MKNHSLKMLAALVLGLSTPLSYSCTTVFANDKGDTKTVARSMDLYTSDLHNQ